MVRETSASDVYRMSRLTNTTRLAVLTAARHLDARKRSRMRGNVSQLLYSLTSDSTGTHDAAITNASQLAANRRRA